MGSVCQDDCVHEIRIAVRVKPGSSRARVGGSYGEDGPLIVAVSARPVDGAANDAVLAAMAAALDVRQRDLSILSGHTARSKVLCLQVHDARAEEISDRLADLRSA
jgi:uncharacterized protein YggU (UPF0235/DUF167 family)